MVSGPVSTADCSNHETSSFASENASTATTGGVGFAAIGLRASGITRAPRFVPPRSPAALEMGRAGGSRRVSRQTGHQAATSSDCWTHGAPQG
jgi:hypothetical protein